MARFEIYTLGGLRFVLDGEQLGELSTRKVEALAIYLAVRQQPQPREALADLLWDDRSQARALSNLRVALSNLRKHLSPYFTITRETATLNKDASIWLDVAELESLLVQIRDDRPQNVAESVAKLEAGLSLYQGDFLRGFSIRGARAFDDWVTVERERMHQLAMDGLNRLVDMHLASGDFPAGINHATRWLQLDPLNETAHEKMIQLLAFSGQSGAAIRQFQECVRIFDEELGLMPSQEIVDLYDAIQAGQLTSPEQQGISDKSTVVSQEEPAAKPGKPPFKGLTYYDVEDGHLFYGREELATSLAGRLKKTRFLAVVGASGSGKSSLVRAGLLPVLTGDTTSNDVSLLPQGSHLWPVHLITPTARPLKALALSLTQADKSARTTTILLDDMVRDPRSLDIHLEKLLADSKAGHVLLVVDQFEELFTQCRDEKERRAFIENLLESVTGEPGGAAVIVIALRADFYAHCARYDGLRELLERNQSYIGSMSDSELRQAIEGPAKTGGWTFEPGLVDLLLHDVGAGRNRKPEPGALPLLSHALLETWKRRRGGEMTFAGYAETGGVRRAIAKTAEAVFNHKLSSEQRSLARSIFIRLTELGEGAQDTRRRAKLEELVPMPDKARAVREVLGMLVDARLLTMTREGVEVAHEALIREWPRLGEWLAEDREGLRIHRQLTDAVQGWLALDKDEGSLYRGIRLGQTAEWANSHGNELNRLEQEFLQASQDLAEREESEREAQRQRELEAVRTLAEAEKRRAEAERNRAEVEAKASQQLRRRWRIAVSALGLASLLAMVALFFGLQFRRSANEAAAQSRLAQARELAARSLELLETDTQLSLLLALEAARATSQVDGFVITEAEVSLYRALAAPELAVLSGVENWISDLAFSPDGDLFAVASADGFVKLYDSDGRFISLMEGHGTLVNTVVFSQDGEHVLTSGDDGTARLWDITGKLITTIKPGGAILSASFSPDGGRILTAGKDAQIWDMAGELITSLEGHPTLIHSASFSPDGRSILAELKDGRAYLWHPNGELVSVLEESNVPYTSNTGPYILRQAANFSPDSKHIVTSGGDGRVFLWDSDGNELAVLEGHEDQVLATTFSPDGMKIASASNDGTAALWSTNGEQLTVFKGHTGRVWSVAFSPDGSQILTGSEDGTARVWRTDGTLLRLLEGHTDFVRPVVFSPDGTRIVTGSSDGTARLWNAVGFMWERLEGHDDWVHQVVFHPDGQKVLTASVDGTARLWDISGSLDVIYNGQGGEVWSALFNADGSEIVTAEDGGLVQVWGLGGELVTELGRHDGAARSASFSPDGDRIISAGDDGKVRLWDRQGNLVAVLEEHESPVGWAGYSPDGSLILTAGLAHIYPQLWDANGKPVISLRGNTRPITGFSFSEDGGFVAASGQDRIARIWDIEGNLQANLIGHTGSVLSVAFSPGGDRILTASNDGTARLWGTDGTLITLLEGHTGEVLRAIFSRDGNRIATLGRDGQVRLWNHEGSYLATLEGHSAAVLSADFSPDGTQLVTSGEDGTVIIWRVLKDIDALVDEAEGRVIRKLSDSECRLYLHLEKCS